MCTRAMPKVMLLSGSKGFLHPSNLSFVWPLTSTNAFYYYYTLTIVYLFIYFWLCWVFAASLAFPFLRQAGATF